MLKPLLLMTFFAIFSVNAQVLSGHQEFVHYSNEQKKEFIIQVMELVTELESKYETAPVPTKQRYSLLLEQFREILISNAHAADVDLGAFATDITTLLDPSLDIGNRCIYAGWPSRTIPRMDHRQGRREICQHPKYISSVKNSAESKAYAKSSSCGKKNQNTISCNPAIFGFKNKNQGSQFCVPAGPAHSENSSYACMQLALGVKKEAGADPAAERIEYLKKQFEGNPTLVNNLFGFIYKTCICDTQENNVINPIYLNNTRPHRTCLGLVNTIAETNHCVEFNTAKSSDMDLFRGIRNFTSEMATTKSGPQVDSAYKGLLGSLKTRFSSDYAQICGGGDVDSPPPTGEGDGTPLPPQQKECLGECDLEDGKLVGCVFKNGDETLEVTPPEDGSLEFTAKVNEEDYLCKITPRSLDHKTSCSLSVDGESVSYSLQHPQDITPTVKATHWTPSQDGAITEKVSFGEASEVSLRIEIEIKGQTASIECGSEKNPKEGEKPDLKLIEDGEDDDSQKFKTEVKPDDNGWSYEWSRSNPPAKSPESDEKSDIKIQGDGDEEEQTPPPAKPESDGGSQSKLDNSGKTYDAPKEKEPYSVCVRLVKGDDSTDKQCKTVNKLKGDDEEKANASTAKPSIGGPQLPKMPQPVRRGVDFSRGGIL